MALLNHAKKELSAKVVYYGPGLSGKTTNLEWIHRKLAPDKRGKLISLETKTDRTLFFDFLPVQIGEIAGFRTRFNVYTVPGQIFYNETRRMVLKGVDGIVFVADSQREMANENLENLKNLAENLRSIGKELSRIPLVLQYNKRDLPNILTVEEMNRLLNAPGLPFFEAVAVKGEGVLTTLTRITRVVADHLRRTLFTAQPTGVSSTARPSPSPAAPVAPPKPAAPPVSGPSPLVPPGEAAAPTFLAEPPTNPPPAARQSAPSEPQVLSNFEEITSGSSSRNDTNPSVGSPPPLASIGNAAPRLEPREEIPSIGDVERSEGPPPSPPPTTPPLEATPAPSPQGMSEPSISQRISPVHSVDPSLVSISAQATPAPGTAQEKVALRFGEPERETGNQIRIPVAIRMEPSKEIVSFQITIRIDSGS